MPFLEWDEKYSVHIAEVDGQHKDIFAIINELHDAMKERRGDQILGRILSELIDYTHEHFATEEKYFLRHKYPGFEVHKSEHDLMRTLVTELKMKHDKEEQGVTIETMELLKDWLSDHVLGADQKYGLFLKERGIM